MEGRNRNQAFDRSDGPTTREDFEAGLANLLRSAAANDVRVEGTIGLCHPSPNVPDWEIEVTRLEKRRTEGIEEG